MASRRPTVRTTTEFRLPTPYPDPTEWGNALAKGSADAGARLMRQWMQMWFDLAGRTVTAWWQAALPRR